MVALSAGVAAAVKSIHNGASSAIQELGVSSGDPTTASTSTSTVFGSMASSMPSLRSLSKAALGGANLLLGTGQAVLGFSGLARDLQTCGNAQLSCQNTTVVENLCCFNAPGGQLLLTQFWDTQPVTGPVDSWTVHGLWPDRCDGSYDSKCDRSREYSNITSILRSFGKTDLLADMGTYWKDWNGDDEQFWEHEWNKHGTCISTMKPECYSDHKATEEVVDYMQKAMDLFNSLPSYDWLAEAGIIPSKTKTYTTAQIQAALSAKRSGVTVTLGCKSGALKEIWYHYYVRGSAQEGQWVPSDPDGIKSTCPATGIRYLPKGDGGSSPTTTVGTSTAAPTATGAPGTPWSGKGFVNVQVGGANKGCIISGGRWYTSGTCATVTAAASGPGFTLSSSKGKCGVVSGALTCGGSVSTATVFTAVGGKLAAGGNAVWSVDAIPRRTAQQKVYAGADHSQTISLVWQAV